MKNWGILLIYIGIICAFSAFAMDTSVATGDGRVNNLGLMNFQSNLIIGGGIAFISGIILFGFSSNPSEVSSNIINCHLNKKCPYCAEIIKKEAIICRYCGKEQKENTDTTVETIQNELPLITKVFFGVLLSGVVVLMIISNVGRKPEPSSAPTANNLAAGQSYILKSVNAYDPASTVRLVSTPGAIAVYDDTEETDERGGCMNLPQGTPVSVLEFADAFGKEKAYAKVRIEEGECKSKVGWALAVEVQ